MKFPLLDSCRISYVLYMKKIGMCDSKKFTQKLLQKR